MNPLKLFFQNQADKMIETEYLRMLNVEPSPFLAKEGARFLKVHAPEFIQNEFGTKVIEPDKEKIWLYISYLHVTNKRQWRYIAHHRLLLQMAGSIFFAELFALVMLIIWTIRK